jgi:steroid 5-alpha reductase family enzyme
MVALLIALWSLRPGAHILVRTREAGDDPRYRELISQWGAHADLRMFLQLQSQAAVGLILALSVSLAAHNTRPSLGLSDFLGFALLVGALAGEAVSDWQLRHAIRTTSSSGSAGLLIP